MRLASILLPIIGALAALVLAVASFLQVPVTKHPTAREIEALERLLEGPEALDQKNQSRIKQGFGRIRVNDQVQNLALSRLISIAGYGFALLSLIFVATAMAGWRARRTRPTASGSTA